MFDYIKKNQKSLKSDSSSGLFDSRFGSSSNWHEINKNPYTYVYNTYLPSECIHNDNVDFSIYVSFSMWKKALFECLWILFVYNKHKMWKS